MPVPGKKTNIENMKNLNTVTDCRIKDHRNHMVPGIIENQSPNFVKLQNSVMY